MNVLGEGPMESIMSHGSVAMLELLLKHGASLEHDKFGTPPLFHAIKYCRHDLAKAMIEAGADVNAHENTTLKTTLHVAAGWGKKAFASLKILLDAGADPREMDKLGNDVLTSAMKGREIFKQHGGLVHDVDSRVFPILRRALLKWKGKPPPKKPRKRRKSDVERKADAMGL